MESLFVSEVTVLGVGSRFKSGGTVDATYLKIIHALSPRLNVTKNFSEVD